MLRLHGVIGHETEAPIRARLHALAHRRGVEYLFVPAEEADRKRFRISTDQGTDCAVTIERSEMLVDGALLYLDEQKAIVVRFGRQRVWRLHPGSAAAALKLGWHAGNLHWRVRFEGETLAVLLDRPVEEYRARVVSLIDSGDVVEVTDNA